VCFHGTCIGTPLDCAPLSTPCQDARCDNTTEDQCALFARPAGHPCVAESGETGVCSAGVPVCQVPDCTIAAECGLSTTCRVFTCEERQCVVNEMPGSCESADLCATAATCVSGECVVQESKLCDHPRTYPVCSLLCVFRETLAFNLCSYLRHSQFAQHPPRFLYCRTPGVRRADG
jgi:hypothetical protein